MAPLTDPERLRAFKNALSNWRFVGYIEFDLNQQAHDWIHRELPNVSLRELAQQTQEYVESGGTIHEIRETREQWSDNHEFHYDIRLRVCSKPDYIETRLFCRLPYIPDEPRIEVVNVHAP